MKTYVVIFQHRYDVACPYASNDFLGIQTVKDSLESAQNFCGKIFHAKPTDNPHIYKIDEFDRLQIEEWDITK